MALQSLTASIPSLDYREDSFRSRLAQQLDKGSFRASTAILVDDLVVLGLFSRIATKPLKRRFFPALFTKNEAPIHGESVKRFREITDRHLGELFAKEELSIRTLNKAIDSMTRDLLQSGSGAMDLNGNPEGRPALLWYFFYFSFVSKNPVKGASRALKAYLGLIAPWSPVHLKVLPMGIGAEMGFGAVAQRTFATGEYIYELIGLFTPDYVEGHTELSTITCPHHHTPHVFWGPIRMVNHDCKPNVQVCASKLLTVTSNLPQYIEVTNRRAMVVAALRDIQPGEELFCDYGKNFWKGPCPCNSCAGHSASTAHQVLISAIAPPTAPPTKEEQQDIERRRAEKAEKERERNQQRRARNVAKKKAE
ncbi:hypothetical protein B0H12DRAFT_1246226 [Mycena haematopus]|nr:hypothetical protein B0H12DRAFT_1246226 [Mycena haematopus]